MRAASGIYHLAAAQNRKRKPRQKNGRPFRKADRDKSIVASGVASQRRVCLTLGVPRSSVRYKPKRRECEESLRGRIKKLAKKHSRYGYRMIWATLRREAREANIMRAVVENWRMEYNTQQPLSSLGYLPRLNSESLARGRRQAAGCLSDSIKARPTH